VFKGKNLESSFIIQLITGSQIEIKSVNDVKATMSGQEYSKIKPVENNTAKMDKTFTAEFPGIKINISTRMAPIQIQFSCNIKEMSGEVIHVESEFSNPIIAITNESQWVEAGGKLFLREVFGDKIEEQPSGKEAPWPVIINLANRLLFQVTQQDIQNPSRSLSEKEINYIHQKYFSNKQKVTKAYVNKFWVWFGHILGSMRFKRHVKTLWCSG
jgi:hypothetical protein